MSQKRSTTGTIASSLVVGLVIGAVATLGYQAYQTTGEDVQELTNDNEAAYGVGGGDVVPDFDETDDVPSLDDKEGETDEGEDDTSADEKKKPSTDPEKETDVGGGVIEKGAGFTFASLAQAQVEEINDESTVYNYGADNAISILSGDTADVALSSVENGDQEELTIDDVDATLYTTISLKDGSTEKAIVVEREDDILFIRGDDAFMESVLTDLSF